jgi:F-type H+-transporting ATPase subunit delta
MSKNPLIAKNYAASLFRVGLKDNNLEKITDNLEKIVKILGKSFISEISNPAISKNALKKISEELSQKLNFEKNSANFLKIIFENRKFKYLDQILDQFKNLIKQQRNILSADFISAHKISDELLLEIKNQLKIKYPNKEIEINSVIEEKILGGFKIKIKSQLIDVSLKNQISNIKKYLSSF